MEPDLYCQRGSKKGPIGNRYGESIMIILRNIVVTMTLAAIATSGAAQARGHGDRDGTRRHDTKIEQRAERRASRGHFGIDGYDRVDRRQDRQRARLIQGRRSGELTRGELRRLIKQQKKIGRMKRRFSWDGHLSGKERRLLERAQDRASRHIAHAKHNHIYKGSGHRHAHSYRSRYQGYRGF
jgi:uncharacterized membrane protein